MDAVSNYVTLKPKRTRQFNRDQSEDDRIRRIRGISQGLILKMFRDPKITIEEKYKVAERILLSTIKSDKEAGVPPAGGETKVVIIRESNGNKGTEGDVPRPVSVIRV